MTVHPQDVVETLKRIRYDLTAAQAKVTDALNYLGELNLPERDEARCPICDTKLKGPLSLAEHVYTSHDGPLPEHYAVAERKAGIA